jgi:uncharacterized repeat protein (TIGR03803 family)
MAQRTSGKHVLGYAAMLAILVPIQLAYAGSYQVLWKFDPSQGDGALPGGGVLRDAAGNLYGTTEGGGAFQAGTVFKLAEDGTETVLYSFHGGNDGAGPTSALITDAAGNFYGTTTWGGTGACGVGCGTVFKLRPDGTETVLHSFQGDGKDGYYPRAGLVMDQAGNLYSTTQGGGTGSSGTVFEVSAGGKEKILHSFTGGDGELPYYGSLLMDTSGNLYGTTEMGGGYGQGVIFMVSSTGAETVLHSCDGYPSNNDCAKPFGGLSIDQNGNLYGDSAEGGRSGLGDVFKLAPDGTFTEIYAFTSDWLPEYGVIRDQSGNLYGTTEGTGTEPCKGCATIFKVTPDGTETVLHRFNHKYRGLFPTGALVTDGNGYLYGTTATGGSGKSGKHCGLAEGPNGCGTVFRVKE